MCLQDSSLTGSYCRFRTSQPSYEPLDPIHRNCLLNTKLLPYSGNIRQGRKGQVRNGRHEPTAVTSWSKWQGSKPPCVIGRLDLTLLNMWLPSRETYFLLEWGHQITGTLFYWFSTPHGPEMKRDGSSHCSSWLQSPLLSAGQLSAC
jgi:hypothetical protein